MYVIGGEDSRGAYTDQILQIDPSSWNTRVVGNLPSPRARLAAAVSDDRIFCIGGWDGTAIDEILVLSISDGKVMIEKTSSLPEGASDKPLLAADTHLYLIGGRNSQIRRLLKCYQIEEDSLQIQPITLRSYAW